VASCWWKPELLESDGRARMQKGESKGSEGREEGRLRERARKADSRRLTREEEVCHKKLDNGDDRLAQAGARFVIEIAIKHV